ncbi:MAG: DNA polymerase [Flavobacterium sp.]
MTKKVIFIDFETRSTVDLKSSGTFVYSESPSTDILCMVWADWDDAPKLFVPETFRPSLINKQTSREDMIKEFEELLSDKECIFVAHNAFFEKCIWQNVMVKKYGMPKIANDRWRCSAAVAASFALPRALSNVGTALNLKQQKDDDGHKVMMALSKPRKETKLNKSPFHTQASAPHYFEKLYDYCIQDTLTERELWKTLRPLSGTELDVWLLDQKINMRGVNVDFKLAQAASEMSDLEDAYLNERIYGITKGEITRATNVGQILAFVNTRLENLIEDVSAGTIRTLLSKPEVQADSLLKEVLEIRQSVGKTSVKKYATVLNSICSDGRLRDLLMYHGASTGRWTGKLVQMQNLPRGAFKNEAEQEEAIALIKNFDIEALRARYKNVKDVLSSCIRGIIVPSGNHQLYVADYASIEARVLFWLAGHEEGVRMYEENQDLYIDMACKIYDKKPEEITKDLRALGKQAILGCGYGMGAKKFQETCANYNMDVSFDLAELAKTTYREIHSPVVNLWGEVERAAIQAVKTGEVVHCGKVSWAKVGKFLHCRLPSGRLLSYYKPRISPVITPWGSETDKLYFWGENSVTRKFTEEGTYGGRLVENITQAVARDLMAEAMLRCEEAGFKILLSVHDELIAESAIEPKREKDRIKCFGMGTLFYITNLDYFIDLLTTKPEWAKGCPIAAEGWTGFRYRK